MFPISSGGSPAVGRGFAPSCGFGRGPLRGGGRLAGQLRGRPLYTHDVVAGPVTLYWDERILIAGADQISFHTDRAATILNTSEREQVFR
jgi:hypothetical protein